MMRNLAIFVAPFCLLTACSWGTGKLRSDWDALQDAKSVSCAEIPIRKDDLRIDRVHIVPELGPSLILEVTTRRGVKTMYHLPFRSISSMDEDTLVALPISQDSILLGAGIWQQKAVFALKTTDRGKPTIQLRDLQSNAVLLQFPIDTKGPWELTDWQIASGKLRSLVREGKDEESLDDQPFLQLEVQLDGKAGAKPRAEPAAQVIGQAQLFGDAQGGTQIVWLDRGTSDKVKEPSFLTVRWRDSKDQHSIDLGDKAPIESWAFQEGKVTNLLSYVKGDTLLWTNASIEIQRLSKSSPFQKQNQLSVPISKVHVARPLLSADPKADYLFLPQWLDHELTVAVYKIESSEVIHRGYRGVFKEGTSFHAAFYHDPSQETLMLMKAPANYTSRYSLCKMNL
jgi:hypothetical protein